jgi:LDH2 family malate/lactate/ureidoglycolate dehydrogenase
LLIINILGGQAVALYPGEEHEQRFAENTLTEVAARIFEACGMRTSDARTVSESLVKADLRGIHSHGLLRVPDYVKKLLEDGLDPKGEPTVVSDAGSALVVDAANNLGQVAGVFAMRAAVARARTTGVALAAVRGSNHCGALDHYARMALAEDMIGIAGTNALPTMAPWGGTAKTVGLNPIAIACPAGVRQPFVLDTALGATAHGKIRIYAQKGHPIPEGWAFDESGAPTTDAVAALAGLIQPIGGHKGIGLAMAVGILSSVLSGARYGTRSGNMIDGAIPGADGQFYLAINIAAFRPFADFAVDMDALLAEYGSSPLAAGFERLYAPGQLEAEIAERNTRLGIPLNAETLRLIRQAAERVGRPDAAAPLS